MGVVYIGRQFFNNKFNLFDLGGSSNKSVYFSAVRTRPWIGNDMIKFELYKIAKLTLILTIVCILYKYRVYFSQLTTKTGVSFLQLGLDVVFKSCHENVRSTSKDMSITTTASYNPIRLRNALTLFFIDDA